jgi:hypothetical protein
MISKIKEKSMRLACRFNFTREIGISLTKKNQKLATMDEIDLDVDVTGFVNRIKDIGFSQTFKIPQEVKKGIVNYARKVSYEGQYSNKIFNIDYDNPTKPHTDLWYLDKDIYTNCDIAKQLAHNTKLVEIAKKYLEKEPKIKSVHSWWSFPQDKESYIHNYGYHYDIDSYKFVKFFIYLTDVDLDCGPHVIVSNTHKRKTMYEKRNRKLTEEQAQKLFKKEQINVMTGKAGEGFFEDTFAYHKGTAPKKPRLIFQVEYSI